VCVEKCWICLSFSIAKKHLVKVRGEREKLKGINFGLRFLLLELGFVAVRLCGERRRG